MKTKIKTLRSKTRASMYIKVLTFKDLKEVIKDPARLQEVKHKLSLAAQDLQTIKRQCNLQQVILQGGSVLGLLLGREIADWDIFYKPKDQQKTWRYYHDKIRSLSLKFMKGSVDTYNSHDVIPWLTPLELTVGVYSDHTEYFSMFAIDEDGKVITNTTAWNNFKNKIYRINPGYFALWGFIKQEEKTIDNFYEILGYALIRSAYYPQKYKLNYAPETIHYFKVTLPFVTTLYDREKKLRKKWDQKAHNKGFYDFPDVVGILQSFI